MRLSLAALLLALACGRARAASASLEFVSGEAYLESGGTRRTAHRGDAVPEGAFVETGKKGAAVVGLPDGTKLKLTSKSRIKVALPEKGAAEALLELGGVFAKVAKQKAGRTFRVRAGNAVASVRGTQFFTAYGRPGKRGRDLWVCVNEGLVDVGTTAADKPLPIKAGEGVLVKSGVDLTKPQMYDWTKTLNWNMDAKNGAVEDQTNLDAAYTDLLDQDYR